MNCIHCKSKNLRKKRVSQNGNIQFQCKECKKYFTIEQIKKWDACYIEKDGSVHKTPKTKKKSDKEEVEIEITSDQILRSCVFAMFAEIEDLESRLHHADKVNLTNVKLMQDIRADDKKKAIEKNQNLQTTINLLMEEKKDQYVTIATRNVVICLLLAGLAILSGMLFY